MIRILLAWYSAWRDQRIAIRRLHQLDDHLLADLGASRDGIEDFVRNCHSCAQGKGPP